MAARGKIRGNGASWHRRQGDPECAIAVPLALGAPPPPVRSTHEPEDSRVRGGGKQAIIAGLGAGSQRCSTGRMGNTIAAPTARLGRSLDAELDEWVSGGDGLCSTTLGMCPSCSQRLNVLTSQRTIRSSSLSPAVSMARHELTGSHRLVRSQWCTAGLAAKPAGRRGGAAQIQTAAGPRYPLAKLTAIPHRSLPISTVRRARNNSLLNRSPGSAGYSGRNL